MRRARPTEIPTPAAVLIDTGAFYALVDTRDEYHTVATAVFDALANAGARLVTTSFILAEVHALILARLRRIDTALAFLNETYSSEYTTITQVTLDQQRAALRLLDRYQDKRFSFTDATSFVIMERLGIDTAFTFDYNFVQYGLRALGLEQIRRQ